MNRYFAIGGACLVFIAGCDQPPPEPPKVEVNVTIEEKEKPKKPVPKDERGTVVGNSEGFFRP
ncbi:MAG: hypothetical protein R3E46_10165 [Sedimenticolaceae bacterium]|jgi:hypothetical protein